MVVMNNITDEEVTPGSVDDVLDRLCGVVGGGGTTATDGGEQ